MLLLDGGVNGHDFSLLVQGWAIRRYDWGILRSFQSMLNFALDDSVAIRGLGVQGSKLKLWYWLHLVFIFRDRMVWHLHFSLWLHHVMIRAISVQKLIWAGEIKKFIIDSHDFENFKSTLIWTILLVEHLFHSSTIEFGHSWHLLCKHGVQLMQIKSS